MHLRGVGRLLLLLGGIAMAGVCVLFLGWITFESGFGGSVTPVVIFALIGSSFAAIVLFGLWYRSGRDTWPR